MHSGWRTEGAGSVGSITGPVTQNEDVSGRFERERTIRIARIHRVAVRDGTGRGGIEADRFGAVTIPVAGEGQKPRSAGGEGCRGVAELCSVRTEAVVLVDHGFVRSIHGDGIRAVSIEVADEGKIVSNAKDVDDVRFAGGARVAERDEARGRIVGAGCVNTVAVPVADERGRSRRSEREHRRVTAAGA